MNHTQLLQNSIDKFHNSIQPEKKVELIKSSLLIQFHDLSKLKDFKRLIVSVCDDFITCSIGLVKNFDSYDEAIKVQNNINKVLSNFDQFLTGHDFEADWLNSFLRDQNFGIKRVRVIAKTLTDKDIVDYISDVAKTAIIDKEYDDSIEKISKQALNYSVDDYTNDFSKFIFANWVGFDNIDAVKDFVKVIIDVCESQTRGQRLLATHPCQETIFALSAKIHSFKGDDTDDWYFNISVPFGEFERNLSKTDLRNHKDLWDCIRNSSVSLLREFSNIYNQGVLIKESDEHSDNLEQTSFKGIDFKDDIVTDINERLSINTIRYEVNEQGRDELTLVVGAIINYWMTVTEIKSEAILDRELKKLATQLDQKNLKPVYDEILSLLVV